MPAWKELPSIKLESPVLALASGNGKLWAGGVGGIAQYTATTEKWMSQSSGLPLSSVTVLTYVYGWLYAGGPEGIARSKDEGKEWQKCEINGEAYPISAIIPSPNFKSDTTLIAATIDGGILRSENAGRTWKSANFGLQNFEVLCLAWLEGRVFAGTSEGIYISPNAGLAWKLIEETEGYVINSISLKDEDSVLASIESGGLFFTRGLSLPWEKLSLPSLPSDIQITNLHRTSTGDILATTVNDGIKQLKGDISSGIWENLTQSTALSITSDETYIYIGTLDGVLVLDKEDQEVSLPTPPIHDVRYLLPIGRELYAAGLHTGLWNWKKDSQWYAVPGVPELITALAITGDGNLILSGSNGVQLSDDGGATWHITMPGQEAMFARLSFREDGYGWAASADGSRLYRSKDNGKSWEALQSPFGVLPVVALQAAKQVVFAATYNPRRLIAQLWYSNDDGDTWRRGVEVQTNWPIVSTSSQPTILSVGGIMYIRQPNGSWYQRKVGAEGAGILRLATDHKWIIVLTTSGLMYSDDQGETWKTEPNPPPEDQILDIAVAEGRIYLLLTEGRVWTRLTDYHRH